MRPTPNATEIEVRNVDIVVSKANEAGDITYANQIFFKLSGYSQAELMEKPHSILRHPDMPKIIFRYLWDNLKEGKNVMAYVKNLTKDGSFYWVLADVKVAKNPDGSLRNYVSTRRGATQHAKSLIVPLYQKLLEAEQASDMSASLPILKEFVESQGGSMETFNETMKKLQTA